MGVHIHPSTTLHAGTLAPKALKGADLALYDALSKSSLPLHIVHVDVRALLCVRLCVCVCVCECV